MSVSFDIKLYWDKLPAIMRQRWERETQCGANPPSTGLLAMIEAVIAVQKNKFKKMKAASEITPERFPTAVDEIASTVYGYTDKVTRVVDTLLLLRKRKDINTRQYLAADKFRNAHEAIYSQVGGSMDFDRVRGGGGAGMGSQVATQIAADTINEAQKKLSPQEFAVIQWVAICGFNLEWCARRIFQVGHGTKVRQFQRKRCGLYLREGLKKLADIWFPQPVGESSRLRTYRDADARPTMCEERDEMPVSKAVHATGQRIFRKEPQRAA